MTVVLSALLMNNGQTLANFSNSISCISIPYTGPSYNRLYGFLVSIVTAQGHDGAFNNWTTWLSQRRKVKKYREKQSFTLHVCCIGVLLSLKSMVCDIHFGYSLYFKLCILLKNVQGAANRGCLGLKNSNDVCWVPTVACSAMGQGITDHSIFQRF